MSAMEAFEPDDDPTPWLATCPTIHLFPRIEPEPSGLVSRLVSLMHRPPSPIGVIELSTTGVTSTRGHGAVAWEERVSVHVSRWQPGPDAPGELALEIRGSTGHVGLRAPWPAASLATLEAPEKREAFAFVQPVTVEPLWRTLSWFAVVHGRRAMPSLDWPSSDTLRQLESAGDVMSCVSCGSYDLTMHGADAYVCRACTYEGGDGWARRARREHLAKLDALSGRARSRAIAKLLDDARFNASAAVGAGWRLQASRTGQSNHDLLSQYAVRIQGHALEARSTLADLVHLSPELTTSAEPIVADLDEIIDANVSDIDIDTIKRVDRALTTLGEDVSTT